MVYWSDLCRFFMDVMLNFVLIFFCLFVKWKYRFVARICFPVFPFYLICVRKYVKETKINLVALTKLCILRQGDQVI